MSTLLTTTDAEGKTVKLLVKRAFADAGECRAFVEKCFRGLVYLSHSEVNSG